MNITDYILESLRKGKSVEIPGIGRWECREEDSHFDKATSTFFPKRKVVGFTAQCTGDDEFIKYVAKAECVGDNVAKQMVANYTAALKSKIQAEGKVEINGLGTLDGNGFTMAENQNIVGGGAGNPLQGVKTYGGNEAEDDPFAAFEQPLKPLAAESKDEPQPVVEEPMPVADEPMPEPEPELANEPEPAEEMPMDEAQPTESAPAIEPEIVAEAETAAAEAAAAVGAAVAAGTVEMTKAEAKAAEKKVKEEQKKAKEAEKAKAKAEREAAIKEQEEKKRAEKEAQKKAKEEKKAAKEEAKRKKKEAENAVVEGENVSGEGKKGKGKKKNLWIWIVLGILLLLLAMVAAVMFIKPAKDFFFAQVDKIAGNGGKQQTEQVDLNINDMVSNSEPTATTTAEVKNEEGEAEEQTESQAPVAVSGMYADACLFTFSEDMTSFTPAEIEGYAQEVTDYMAEYIAEYVKAKKYSGAKVPMMDRVKQYAEQRLEELLTPQAGAVENYIPAADYMAAGLADFKKIHKSRKKQVTVQTELLEGGVLENMLNTVVTELGIKSDVANVVMPPKTVVETPVIKTERKSRKGFDLIAGYYVDANVAYKMQQRLKGYGYNAYIIEINHGYYVSMASAKSRTEADAMLLEAKKWYDGDLSVKQGL